VSVRRLLLTVPLALSLSAHDLYLRLQTYQPAPGATVRVEFHNGDKFPASEMPVKIERLRDTRLVGGAEFQDLRIEGTATVADVVVPSAQGLFTLTARTIPNFIQLDAKKFEDYLQHEGLQTLVEWRKQHGEAKKPGREHYSKYFKALGYVGAPTGKFDAPAGLALEFIPLGNPYAIKAGEPLRVRVLFRSKRQVGLAVALAHADGGRVSSRVVGVTNAQGEIAVPIAGAGLWKLHTIMMERKTNSSQADWESFWASFTFELPGAMLSTR
jgi:hypothetical protein